jgi:tRNA G46 methylase TrmB
MVNVIAERLLPDGELLVITDVDAYAAHTSKVMSSVKNWTPTSYSRFNKHRIETNYEKKALAESRQISELSFQLKL